MAMLAEGAKAPEFSVVDENDKPATLSDFSGRRIVLWWYPKADTPG